MSLPDFSMRQLLEAGVHFGHQAHRWNPKMAEYIFGARNNIHIIDLAQSVPMMHRALQAVSDTVANGGRILFVGTKRQAQDAIAAAAKKSAQYYVNSRWLGGTLTNWKTISQSINRLRKLDEMLSSGASQGYTKKERLTLQRERDKLDRALGGIKDMGGLPDLLFVIDTNKEAIAVAYPRDRMYGVWWSGAEPDVTPAGDQSKGYKALMLQHGAGKFKVTIGKEVYGTIGSGGADLLFKTFNGDIYIRKGK